MEAKLFKVGGGQAVRVAKDFRFAGDRVRIRREGTAVILETVTRSAAETLEFLRSVSIPGFMPHGRDQPRPRDRG